VKRLTCRERRARKGTVEHVSSVAAPISSRAACPRVRCGVSSGVPPVFSGYNCRRVGGAGERLAGGREALGNRPCGVPHSEPPGPGREEPSAADQPNAPRASRSSAGADTLLAGLKRPDFRACAKRARRADGLSCVWRCCYRRGNSCQLGTAAGSAESSSLSEWSSRMCARRSPLEGHSSSSSAGGRV
jgi:hypothetical protein